MQNPAEPDFEKMMHDEISDFRFRISDLASACDGARSSIANPQSAILNSFMSIYRRVLRYYRPFLGADDRRSAAVACRDRVESAQALAVQVHRRRHPASRHSGITRFQFADWRHRYIPLALPRALPRSSFNFSGESSICITNYIFVKVGLQALLKLRTDLYAYLQSLSLKYHDARRSSDSSFRVAYDSQSIQTIYNKGFTNIFGSVITLIGTFVIMLRLDWQLTLLSLGIVPLIVGAIYFFAHRIRTRIDLRSRNRKARCSPRRRKGLSSIRMVHAFGREELEVSQFHQRAQQSLQANLRLTLTNVKSALVISTLMVIGTAAMYYLGTLHVLPAHSRSDRSSFSAPIC